MTDLDNLDFDDNGGGSSSFDDFVRRAYDKVVYDAGEDGLKIAEARLKVTQLVREAIAAGWLEAPDVDAPVAKAIQILETRRRHDLSEAIKYAASARAGETILGPDDPSLTVAYPVSAGVRKSLLHCNKDDLDGMVSTRRENMAHVVASFNEFAADVDRLKGTMTAYDARIVHDLFVPGPDQ